MKAIANTEDLLLALTQRTQQAVDPLVFELKFYEMLDRSRGLAQVLGRELLEGMHVRGLVERL